MQYFDHPLYRKLLFRVLTYTEQYAPTEISNMLFDSSYNDVLVPTIEGMIDDMIDTNTYVPWNVLDRRRRFFFPILCIFCILQENDEKYKRTRKHCHPSLLTSYVDMLYKKVHKKKVVLSDGQSLLMNVLLDDKFEMTADYFLSQIHSLKTSSYYVCPITIQHILKHVVLYIKDNRLYFEYAMTCLQNNSMPVHSLKRLYRLVKKKFLTKEQFVKLLKKYGRGNQKMLHYLKEYGDDYYDLVVKSFIQQYLNRTNNIDKSEVFPQYLEIALERKFTDLYSLFTRRILHPPPGHTKALNLQTYYPKLIQMNVDTKGKFLFFNTLSNYFNKIEYIYDIFYYGFHYNQDLLLFQKLKKQPIYHFMLKESRRTLDFLPFPTVVTDIVHEYSGIIRI